MDKKLPSGQKGNKGWLKGLILALQCLHGHLADDEKVANISRWLVVRLWPSDGNRR
ncbi:unnamed protein product [Dovyalis caffra]|uniref:Uncharacterized protein n=1 Tax=Dovyalis caffra TaxID=77055 RepID=A0AAV1S5D2_9ROSI|nr:unnamed protein product [Dovyalis caffra]